MTITIEFNGQLRQLTQAISIERTVNDGATVAEALMTLRDDYDDTFRSILYGETGEVSTTALILLKDEPVARDPWPVLSDGDVITILPPIAGG